MQFVITFFSYKIGPHYKFRTPLQNQDQEPFSKSQQQEENHQIEPLQNGLSSLHGTLGW